jgi:phosphatidate cytidylyltransferase
MSGLRKRVLTSVVALPILIGLIGWVPWYGFSTLVWLGITIAFHEFFAMVLREESAAFRRGCVFLGSLLTGIAIFTWKAPAAYGLFVSPPLTSLLWGGLVAVALMMLILRGSSEDLSNIPKHLTGIGFGLFYLTICGSHIAFLSRLPETSTKWPNGWVFLALAATFMTDTGGYFFGKSIGGPKLAPSVSPNKTWAGLFGCFFGGTLGAVLAKLFWIPMLIWVDCVVIGVCFALIGQMGDLLISMLKRAFQIKDTGHILPGHGGMLDRIDGLLFTGSFLFYYATWFVLPRGIAG